MEPLPHEVILAAIVSKESWKMLSSCLCCVICSHWSLQCFIGFFWLIQHVVSLWVYVSPSMLTVGFPQVEAISLKQVMYPMDIWAHFVIFCLFKWKNCVPPQTLDIWLGYLIQYDLKKILHCKSKYIQHTLYIASIPKKEL